MSALDDLAPMPFHDAPDAQRARMLSRLADTELCVALTREPADDQVQLRLFPLDAVQVALACDSEDRLAGFFGTAVAYAAMPGRVLAGLLRADGAGLLVNPGHPSEMLLDAPMLDWLAGALAATPLPDEARLRLAAPRAETVAALAEPLAARLLDMRGLISGAALAGVLPPPPDSAPDSAPDSGPDRAQAEAAQVQTVVAHVLLVSGAEPDRQPAIAKALAEALAFLPPQPGGVDISFPDAAFPQGALQFDLGEDDLPDEPPAAASRPKGPPILR